MSSIIIIINSTVLYTWNLLKECILDVFITQKIITMWGRDMYINLIVVIIP
jgi:hypothetical protein